jgi:hypothetical protein
MQRGMCTGPGSEGFAIRPLRRRLPAIRILGWPASQ